MSYLDYYKEINAQKIINRLAAKYKDKKIIIYGAGIMSRVLFENFDVSKLNIIAICDSKYTKKSLDTFFSYPVINPSELKDKDFDIIFVNLKRFMNTIEQIKYKILINTKNEDKIVKRFLSPSLSFYIKQIIF